LWQVRVGATALNYRDITSNTNRIR
jgi:hypothetical protein